MCVYTLLLSVHHSPVNKNSNQFDEILFRLRRYNIYIKKKTVQSCKIEILHWWQGTQKKKGSCIVSFFSIKYRQSAITCVEKYFVIWQFLSRNLAAKNHRSLSSIFNQYNWISFHCYKANVLQPFKNKQKNLICDKFKISK